jgi:CBS domain-containing protein/sporulation protein YlmC with PRC-barrel domain
MLEVLPISTNIATSASALLGREVADAQGNVHGRVTEFAVDVARDEAHIAALVLKTRKDGKTERLLLPVAQIEFPGLDEKPLVAKARPTPYVRSNEYLLLDYDLLDQQIIDVDGRKVVRVNDVNLEWEQVSDAADAAGFVTGLRIAEVEVGTRGASRRLFKGLPPAFVNGVSSRFQSRVIPWACVDLIERDPARRVRLKIGQERLAKLHPSDIAEILEELAPAERDAVFAGLDEETAAETLEEVEPKLQKALLEGLDSEKAADILEEMDPGAAADVLSELSDEQSEAILEEMEPEERHDLEELLEFHADSAAGLMTTDYLSVPVEATVADGVEALRAFEGDPDTVTELYLVGDEDKLMGVVTLPKLLLAGGEVKLKTLTDGHKVSCGLHAKDTEVAELFDKYNLRSLPVVDSQGRLAGVVNAEQVIGQLLAG